MIMIKCNACGASEIKKVGNMYVCSYCGSKYIYDNNDMLIDKELTDLKVIAILHRANESHKKNNFSEEMEALIEAYNMDKDNAEITVRIGRCYRCLELPEKAIEYYKRTIELNPYSGTAYTNMGTIYILRQNYAEAAKCYEKGLPLIDKATNDYWVAYANYAIVIARQGDKSRAKKMIREAEAHGYYDGDAARRMAEIKTSSLASIIRLLIK